VAFVSATEGHFDFTQENEFREVIIFMTSWMNNWFLRNLSRSTRRGKEAATMAGRKQGKHKAGCGRDFPCPYGTHDANGKNVRAVPKTTLPKAASAFIEQPAAPVGNGGA
jgi:hypothetical protein